MATSKKYDSITISVTGYQKKKVKERAHKKGMYVSEYIKDLINQDLKKV
jgi:predicted DNA binding CopG/RHH family protein